MKLNDERKLSVIKHLCDNAVMGERLFATEVIRVINDKKIDHSVLHHLDMEITYDPDSSDFEFRYANCKTDVVVHFMVEKSDVVRMIVLDHISAWGYWHPDDFTWIEAAIARHFGEDRVREFYSENARYDPDDYRQAIESAFDVKDLTDKQIMIVAREFSFGGPGDKFIDPEELVYQWNHEFEGTDGADPLHDSSIDEIVRLASNQELYTLFDDKGEFAELEQMESYRKLTPWIPRKEK